MKFLVNLERFVEIHIRLGLDSSCNLSPDNRWWREKNYTVQTTYFLTKD